MAVCNVGSNERILRLLLGIGAAVAAFAAPVDMWVRVLLGGVALAGIITGVVRCSPLNSVLGINNCK